MKRLIDKTLLDWKNDPGRKPLVIRGARQVGKTYSVEQFGKTQFTNFVKVDFENERSVHKIFDGDLQVERLILQLEANYEQRILPGKTLLFFDEIQECPRALTALRYFYEQMPELHLIAAGSLLEFALGEQSFPVGRVRFEWLRPMGFEEFLWATGKERLAEFLPDLDATEAIPEFIHEKLIDQLRYYFFVGGMPEAVKTFAETFSSTEVARIHKELAQSYLQDFAKYQSRIDRDCMEQIFNQIPGQVGHRIIYSSLYPEKRIETIKSCLHLLELMLIIQRVHSTHAQGIPLGADASPKIFKAIFLDIGLLQFLCGISSPMLLNEKELLNIYRGALAEQFVGQELLLHGGSENERLYYWDRPQKSSSAEVDYVIVRQGEIIPIEVKSSSPGKLKSMSVFLNEHAHCRFGIVLYSGNISMEPTYRLKYLPLYTKLIPK